MKYTLLTITIFILFSCNDSTSSSAVLVQEEFIDTSLLMDNAAVCDSCISRLVVYHLECTECKDVYVDSGAVFITKKILKDYSALIAKKNKPRDVFDRLNSYDLYFEDSTDFYKLWPDSAYYSSALSGFEKKFLVTGRITQDRYSLRFKLLSFKYIGDRN